MEGGSVVTVCVGNKFVSKLSLYNISMRVGVWVP